MHSESKSLQQTQHTKLVDPAKPVSKRQTRRRAKPLSTQEEELVVLYAPAARRGLRKLFRENKRYFDLATVFPAAAYALTTSHRPASARKFAAKLVVDGAPLKHIAKALELPLWLRRLPPRSFCGDLDQIPSNEAFSRRIANRIPTGREADAFWLESVCFCAKAASDDFGLWIASKRIFAKYGEAEKMFATLAAYAWHSRNVQCRAHDLIVVPWHPEIAFDTALCAAKSWLNRLRLVMQLEEGAISDPWLNESEIQGFRFSPLLNHEQLLDEARSMQNCSDQYAVHLSRDRCRLFSITRRGMHVATMEIGPHPRETGVITITQLKGRHNMPASLTIWQAAHAWLATQSGLKRLAPKTARDLPLNPTTWNDLLSDYREATDGAKWLPIEATPSSFLQLENALTDLARRAGVRSWLFTGG